MGMGKDHGVDFPGMDRKGLPVATADGLYALEQAAVDENAGVLVGQQVAGAGNGAGGTQKADFHEVVVSFRCWRPAGVRGSVVPPVVMVVSSGGRHGIGDGFCG
jgi:hypothetical protein